MSGRLRCSYRNLRRAAVVTAGGECLPISPSLQRGKFGRHARGSESANRLGLAEIIGFTPRLQAETEAVTAIQGIQGIRVKGKK